MQFNEKVAAKIALEWNLDKYEIDKWRARGTISDYLASHLNFAKPHRLVWYHRFLSMCGDGWVNAERLCAHYGWYTRRISDLMSFQRNPGKLNPRTLYGEEIDQITLDFLAPLQTMVDSVLERAKNTPVDQMYSDALQADLALILRVSVLRASRCRQGLAEQDLHKLRRLQAGKCKSLPKFEDKIMLRDVFRQLGGLQAILNEAVPVDTQILTENHKNYEREI